MWTAPLKVLVALIGIFWMAIGAGWAVYWWATTAPLGWPNYRLGGKVIGITLHLPDPPGAQLAAMKAAAAKSAAKAKDTETAQHAASVAIGLGEAMAQERIRTVYRTIRTEIHDHVSPAIDRAFPMPVGLVRLHDAAARGLDVSAVPDSAGQPDDAASRFAASDLAGAFTDNYGACRANAEQLSGLQSWIRLEAAIK